MHYTVHTVQGQLFNCPSCAMTIISEMRQCGVDPLHHVQGMLSVNDVYDFCFTV